MLLGFLNGIGERLGLLLILVSMAHHLVELEVCFLLEGIRGVELRESGEAAGLDAHGQH
jgi:hypothetical protein